MLEIANCPHDAPPFLRRIVVREVTAFPLRLQVTTPFTSASGCPRATGADGATGGDCPATRTGRSGHRKTPPTTRPARRPARASSSPWVSFAHPDDFQNSLVHLQNWFADANIPMLSGQFSARAFHRLSRRHCRSQRCLIAQRAVTTTGLDLNGDIFVDAPECARARWGIFFRTEIQSQNRLQASHLFADADFGALISLGLICVQKSQSWKKQNPPKNQNNTTNVKWAHERYANVSRIA